jgi:serine/threonine protein phosphatase PrpC
LLFFPNIIYLSSPIDITIKERDIEADEYMIIACDGVWDVVSNDEAITMVSAIFNDGETNLGKACEEVLDLCLAKNSRDNMTCSLIAFKGLKIGDESKGGVEGRRRVRAAFEQEEVPAEEEGAVGPSQGSV